MSITHRVGLVLASATVVSLGLVPAAQASPAHRATTTAGYDKVKLHQRIKALRTAGATGMSIEVKGPAGTYRNAAGYANVGTRRAAATTDRYHVASVTKSMVSALVHKEIAAGNWTARTRIDDVAPHLYPGAGSVTVGDLLSHRSGMPNHTEVMSEELNGQEWWTRRWYDTRLIAYARKDPFFFKAGTNARYSNTGYVVLGKMLERQNGGKSLAGLLEYRIFKPAGMTNSRLSQSSRFARSGLHEYISGGGATERVDVNPSIFSGSGGVESTTADVDRFYKALFTGKLIPAAQVNTMITAKTTTGGLAGYGSGIYAVNGPCGVLYGHDGASIGTRNFAFSTPDGKTQVNLVWTNRNFDKQPDPLDSRANDLLIEALNANCTPKVGSDKRTPSVPVAPSPDIDAQHAPKG